MIVYRILHKTVKQLLIGSGNEGRWCSGGRKVIYMSSSVALACLENILRRSGSGFSTDFRTIFYEIPGDIIIEELLIKDLDPDWRLHNSYAYCQTIGNNWYDKKDSSILKVPSAIISDEFNYVIKTSPQNNDHIKIVDNKQFMPDERLENILQNVDINKLKKLNGPQKSRYLKE
jgi:RES domain-containing protein